jgi:F-type H+-transporting ATPase subunit d
MSGKAVQKAKAIDWDYLQKVVVSDSGKRELAALHRAYDDVTATINEKFNIKPTNINWGFYKEKLGPSIVNIFQESVNSLEKEVPEYQDDVTADYQAKLEALTAKATEQEEESKKKIITLEKEIARVQEQKAALGTMTVDEYFAKNPQSKEKIDDEIRNQFWGY